MRITQKKTTWEKWNTTNSNKYNQLKWSNSKLMSIKKPKTTKSQTVRREWKPPQKVTNSFWLQSCFSSKHGSVASNTAAKCPEVVQINNQFCRFKIEPLSQTEVGCLLSHECMKSELRHIDTYCENVVMIRIKRPNRTHLWFAEWAEVNLLTATSSCVGTSTCHRCIFILSWVSLIWFSGIWNKSVIELYCMRLIWSVQTWTSHTEAMWRNQAVGKRKRVFFGALTLKMIYRP